MKKTQSVFRANDARHCGSSAPCGRLSAPRLFRRSAPVLAALALAALLSCKSHVSGGSSGGLDDSTQDTPSSVTEYTGGINGSDNYTSMAEWSNRKNWNLANVHDPSVAKWTDGYYYMYQTDASYGNAHSGHGHFYCRRSKDLVNWSYVGMAFPENGAKAWILEKVNEYRKEMNLDQFSSADDISWGYWAPSVETVTTSKGKVMRMYYSVVIDNYIYSGKKNGTSFDNSWTERAFIGLAESTDPASNKWEDKGFVLGSSSAKGSNFPAKSGDTADSSAAYYRASTDEWNDTYFYYNAIDPAYFTNANGTSHYLIYGSWHHGFAGLEIDAESGMPKGFVGTNDDGSYCSKVGKPWADSAEGLATNGYGTRVYCRGANDATWQGSEGPEVIYNDKDSKYYLFFANDALDVPYHTRVVRSDSPIEGYEDIYGRSAINSGKGTGSCYPIVTHPYKFQSSSDSGTGGYGWVGISHCTVFEFESGGDWYYASQGRLPDGISSINASNAVMMGHVRKILWCPNGTDTSDLWPVASPERYANIDGKSDAITESDIAGKWDHINLVYDWENMDTSAYVYFNSNKSVTGALTGSWELSTDTVAGTTGGAGHKYLTITLSGTKPENISDKKILLVLDREYDWETGRNTIVYAGISSAKSNTAPVTFWGKRVNDSTTVEKTALATVKFSVPDNADSMAFYFYPQYGTWTVTTDGTEETVTAAEGWWTGSESNQSAHKTVADGGGYVITAVSTSSTVTPVFEAQDGANNYLDIDLVNYNAWANPDTSNTVTAQSWEKVAVTSGKTVECSIQRSGTTFTVDIKMY